MIQDYLNQIYLPPTGSHKGQNGKLLLIGGSKLFHAASLWALKTASRIVDLVHYASVPENNEILLRVKSEFRDGIVVPRSEVDNYVEEDDCILIGPGMVRAERGMSNLPAGKAGVKCQMSNISEINKITDEGIQTYCLTKYLLKKYPHKKWVIDAGALQMMELEWIPHNAILTPHRGEFTGLELRIKNDELRMKMKNLELKEKVKLFAKEFQCIVLLKGEEDIVCSREKCEVIKGGNAGMTKGGTGDVLAGLVAALYCKNDPFLAARAGSFLNKLAGDRLYKKVGIMFNASDLTEEIPGAYKWCLGI